MELTFQVAIFTAPLPKAWRVKNARANGGP